MTRRSRWGAAMFAAGVGLAVTAGAGSAAADDAGDNVQQDVKRGPAHTADHASRPPSNLKPVARQTRSARTAVQPAAAGTSTAATTKNVAPQDPFTAALTAIGREINRLFFNRTPTANPRVDPQRVVGVVTGVIGGADPEDDALAYRVIAAPTQGTVSVDAAGEFTYTANEQLAAAGGADTFMVSVRDTGFHLNFWVPTTIVVPVSVTVIGSGSSSGGNSGTGGDGGDGDGDGGSGGGGDGDGSGAGLPAVSLTDLAVTEGDGAHAHFMFTATLDRASATPVTVRYTTADGTAVAGVDYLATAGMLTFAAGTTTQTVHVDILGDTVDEPDETFSLVLTGPTGARIVDLAALGTIIDDDPAALTPGLSVSDVTAAESATGVIAPGFLHTAGNQIVDSAGNPVQIAGVNWFGLESSTGAPHGLWTRGYRDMIDQMAAEGFNTIRLPYASETLHTTAPPNGIDFAKNPDLQGLSSLEVMDSIISYAGGKGMRVILDHHRSGFGSGTSGNGLWYDTQSAGVYTEDAWVADWAMLAARYADDPTVIGFDLHNEPYNGTWGGGGATDWARAAERAGNAALAVNPDLLIFVEGVATHQGQSYWWGGNLMGAADRPIVLNVPGRVVYSPHDYPNSVYPQPWFAAADFGAALPAKFRQMWGYLYEQNIAPVYVGEFGTNLRDPKDVIWFEAITSYLSGDFDNNGTADIPAGREDLSWTFWSWNPNSGDTGGILADDWTTVNENKMAYLDPIRFTGGPSVATFTVSLSAPSTQPVTVRYATADGTATAGADYTSTTGTLTFAPGETRKTVAVAITADGIAESAEDFHLMLSGPSGATLADAMGMGTITAAGFPAPPAGPGDPTGPTDPGGPAPSGYVDLMTFGMFHGSSHTADDGLVGGRTAITTEALVAYNDLRRFSGLAPATLDEVGRWAFANGLTNNAEAWGNDVQGVGLYYAMQGAKVGWIAAEHYDPQIVADIERTARLGSTDQVMAMVARYGRPGFADYLIAGGHQVAFVDTLRMEPHYAGWMHDRANGRRIIEGATTAHDLNHLTVLSHDQMQPFMNDTWDWPQWPALEVSDAAVLGYFRSMVTLTDPLVRTPL